MRAKKESEAYNAGDEEGDDAGGEIDVGWRELPRYFKVRPAISNLMISFNHSNFTGMELRCGWRELFLSSFSYVLLFVLRNLERKCLKKLKVTRFFK